MRALVFDPSLRLDRDRTEPPAREGDTLLRVRVAGICSTDLEICRGYMGFAGVLGHEFVADVVESANASLVGRRVVAEINCVCGQCDLCRRGLPTHCRDRTVVGILNHGGAFADFLRVPAANCHVVPDLVDDDQAVFVEPLAAAFQILRQVPIDASTSVTLLGDGRLGLLCAQVLKNAGAAVRVVGRNENKLALCDRWGIATQVVADVDAGHDQDVVVDATGSADGLELAMRLVRPRGTIVLKSTVAEGKPLTLAPLVIDEVTIVGSRCGPFDAAIDPLARDEIDVRPLIHSRYSLDDGVEAMRVAGTRGVLKVLLDVNG
jgi:threonine dehydrogenase-like Zn-dependent dehydrogenase